MKNLSTTQLKDFQTLSKHIDSRKNIKFATTFRYINYHDYLGTLFNVLTNNHNIKIAKFYLNKEDDLIDSESIGNDFDVTLNDLNTSIKKTKIWRMAN